MLAKPFLAIPVPPPLSARQRRVVVILVVCIAATRLLAVSSSLWDWDEVLFALALRDGYDVTIHQPHPPGYPLFIAVSKLVSLFGFNEFRALQTVVVVSSMLLFPVVLGLARELAFSFRTAVAGAAVYSLLPSVWIYSGTAFSDIPATVLGLAACMLFLRSRRAAGLLLAGALLLAAAVAIRPLMLLVGMAPLAVALYSHRFERRRVFVALAAAVAAIAVAYAAAAFASGSRGTFGDALRGQADYVARKDSFQSVSRPPLPELASYMLLTPTPPPVITTLLAVLAIAAIALRTAQGHAGPLLIAAMLLPFGVVTWLMLDWQCTGRYMIPYLLAHALLGVDGLDAVITRLVREPRLANVATTAGLVLVTVPLVAWTWPGLTQQRTTASPPAAAFEWLRRASAPRTTLYIHPIYEPHARYFLRDREWLVYRRPGALPPLREDVCVVVPAWIEGGVNFARPRFPLWGVVRPLRFEISVVCGAQ